MPGFHITAFRVVQCRPGGLAALVTTTPLSPRHSEDMRPLDLLERGAAGGF